MERPAPAERARHLAPATSRPPPRIGDTRPRSKRPRRMTTAVPPIDELTRIEPVYLDRLEKQGVFTTGILLEVSETPTRRQTLADHLGATINDVATWRDEALMLTSPASGRPSTSS